VVATGAWQRFASLAYTAKGTGGLDLYVYEWSSVAGDWFEADGLSLAKADSTPPETTIGGGPSGSTEATDASISFSANEAGSTFACSLDGAAFTACASPVSYSGLLPAEHVMRVRATDRAGNADPTPAERRWTVVLPAPTGPNLLANGGFDGSTNGWRGYGATLSLVPGLDGSAARATVAGAATNFSLYPSPLPVAAAATGAVYTSSAWVRGTAGRQICLRVRGWAGAAIAGSAQSCLTASGAWQRFAPVRYTALGSGALDVYAYLWGARAGDRFDLDALTLTTPDRTPPEAALVSPSAAVVAGEVRLAAAAADPSGIARVDFVLGSTVVATDTTAPFETSWDSRSRLDGGVEVGVLAVDAAGNEALSSRIVRVDNTAPRTTIMSADTAVAFTADEAGATFACSLDGAEPAACTSPVTLPELPVGEHRFQVRATDAVGNAEAVAAERAWTVEALGPADLVATTVDNAHVRLEWPRVAGAATYRVLRGDLHVGSTPRTTFTDALLWPSTTYAYAVQALAADGAVLSRRTVEGATAALPAEGFQRPFAPTSFWNTPVGDAPTHARNADLMSYFVANAQRPNLTLHGWGVPVAEAHPDDPLLAVPCTEYVCTLDAFGPVPIPVTAVPDADEDGHIAIYDPVTQREWGMWQAKNAGGSWSASAGAAVSTAGDGVAPPKIGSGNAANFPMLGGIVRPEEILQGRIDHALVFGLPGIGAGPPVCPATHNAATSSDPNALREGMRLQLDPSLDVDSLPVPAWQKVVMRAMQTYGMYLRDNSGSLAVYAENPVSRGYDAWALVGLPGPDNPGLAGIPWDRFRVIDAPDC